MSRFSVIIRKNNHTPHILHGEIELDSFPNKPMDRKPEGVLGGLG
jgi:hypothetical protein